MTSCTGKERGGLSSDVVTNPNSAKGNPDLSSLPRIQFEKELHDFGKLIEGESVSYSFKFTNTGQSDLVIADVTTSCGCTVPVYPKTPVRPGQQETIKVTFNSAGKKGFQTKNIVIIANTQPNTTILKIKAEVMMSGIAK